jgi:2-polyprenyl-3-methyl-5-hydroxy-6-metoxy-1,4-benzoquinol methylase
MSEIINPATHEDWLRPHSIDWYAQLGKQSGQFAYPWNTTMLEPNGESLFVEEVAKSVPGKKVLDIGCGHGEFTIRWSPLAKQVVGLDITPTHPVHPLSIISS